MKTPLVATSLFVPALGVWSRRHRRDKVKSSEIIPYGNENGHRISLAFDGGARVVDLRGSQGKVARGGQVSTTLDIQTLALQAEQAQAQIGAKQQNLLRLKRCSRSKELAQVFDHNTGDYY